MPTQTDPLHHLAELAEDTRREAYELDLAEIPVHKHELIKAAQSHSARVVDLLFQATRQPRPDFLVPEHKTHRQQHLEGMI